MAGAPLWLHGDLHPANVVVREGMLTGVIDFGEMCAGDPATDLSAAWILLPASAARRFFDAYGRADNAMITRARGWAVLRALGQTDLGTSRLRHPRTGPDDELTASRRLYETTRAPNRTSATPVVEQVPLLKVVPLL
ncbi:phosphotransferase [Rhodococcus sp. T7]|uniref:phosphotransferase n=1 Tax=Rhodococcus sp. T7 TaxID=627444 RepID=UPI0022A8C514|nr:phosphotransferase [Rhodococcus sp. T7]